MSDTVNKSFTAVGVGGFFFIRPGQSLLHVVSGTFVGTVVLEKTQNNGVTIEPANVSETAPASSTITVGSNVNSNVQYRWRCSAFTSGTIVTSIADAVDDVPGTQVNTDEDGSLIHKTTDDGIQLGDDRDIVAGPNNGSSFGKTSAEKVGFHGKKTDLGDALTVETSAISYTPVGLTSAAIGTLTSGVNFGFQTQGEGDALVQKVISLETRLGEVEARGVDKGIHA